MRRTFFSCLLCAILVGCSRIPIGSGTPSAEKTWHVPPGAAQSSVRVNTEPTSLLIDVPFASQAPLRNWDALHEETCEEASLIMVARYWNREPLTPQIMEEELQKLVSWEREHGYGDDVTVEQLAEIAREYFHVTAVTDERVDAATVKEYLAQGKPVIVPAAGRDLGNPYFSGEGPWYHMLVITGYDDRRFYTNDPGTRRGENFVYDQTTLLNAVHDWTGVKETIREGKRCLLIIETASDSGL